jgi:hypothetical protein
MYSFFQSLIDFLASGHSRRSKMQSWWTRTGHMRVIGQRWWRFTRYEIRGGRICPAKGADLVEYDPLAHSSEARGKRAMTAYSGLFQAVEQGAGGRQTLKRQEALLEWCGKNGLLGLLLHGVEWIAIPNGRLAYDTVYSPTAIGWESRNVLRRELFLSGDRPDRPPMARFKTSPTGEAATYTLDSEPWMRFFKVYRRKEKRYFFAAPTSAEFRRHYVESVASFVAAARSLKQAAENLEKSREVNAEPARRWGERELNALLSAVGVAVTWEARTRSYQQVWTSRSLLGALALQVLEDLSVGRRIVACGVCATVFVGGGSHERFCSRRCYWTWHKRITRRNKRTPKRPASQTLKRGV